MVAGILNLTNSNVAITACNISLLTMSPVHGEVQTSGNTATYTCDNGYTLSGAQSRTCGADGMWSSVDPECKSE